MATVVQEEITGRNDHATANALEAMTQVMARANHNAGADEFHGLGKLKKNKPPTSKGRYDLEGAQLSIGGRIPTKLEAAGTAIIGDNFKKAFLDKYFPTYVCNRKEKEFLELGQGNMFVADYVAKFEELFRFYL
ncbi:uncharacterized protein LOC131613667 [Vicia villosa]|uniref:uncharacterized protein LOC131613667 n=1 Tax=Vicia villosa TaxID=3911 RepID=UPI00273BF0B5|nr:uncharacterized protein LOC131613667 [Vicia villosa]